MSIKRDDLDAGRVDFSEVATGKRLPLIHPGEIGFLGENERGTDNSFQRAAGAYQDGRNVA